eukprot:SAG22_NODE_975_length_6203_cov_25.423001_5_plen_194_part_00
MRAAVCAFVDGTLLLTLVSFLSDPLSLAIAFAMLLTYLLVGAATVLPPPFSLPFLVFSLPFLAVPLPPLMTPVACPPPGVLFYSNVDCALFECGTEATVVQSLYYSVVTLTTVGYGEMGPKSQGTRVFTTFFALFGIGAGCVPPVRSLCRRARLRSILGEAGPGGTRAHTHTHTHTRTHKLAPRSLSLSLSLR